jgi:pimeloyl-ACP methyl ester carboxylesterase
MMNTIVKTMGLLVVLALVGLIGCQEAMAPSDGGTTTETTQQGLSGNAGPTSGVHYADTTDGEQIAYRVVGSGATDIILVHGWSVSGAVYDNLVAELQSGDYRLLIPDLRGTGDSSKPSTGYTLDNYAEDVLAVARDANVGRFVLVGHSMGGAIAQKLATMRPGRIQGLVLMSPVPASGFPLPTQFYNLFYASANDPALQEMIFNISSVALDPADLQNLLASAATVAPVASQESLDAWTQADFADQIFKIRAQTLIVVSDDPFMPAPFLQQAVADPIGDNASVHYFSGAGHYVQVEMAAQTSAAIDGFISSLQPGFGR